MTKELTRHDFGGFFHINSNGAKVHDYLDAAPESRPSEMKSDKLKGLYREKEAAEKIVDEKKRTEALAEIESKILFVKEYFA